MSSIGAGLLKPEATTSRPTAPKASMAASTIASATSTEAGRATHVSTAARVARASWATEASGWAEPDTSSSRQRSATSGIATARPNAPDAPVMTATRSETSNSDSGAVRAALRSGTGLDAERLLRIDHGHHADRGALALGIAPRERHERAPLAGHRVELAADVLDPRDAGEQHRLVRGLPVGEVLHDVAPGLGPVLLHDVRVRRPVAVRDDPRA